MNSQEYLLSIKTQLKLLLIEQLEKSLEHIDSLIVSESEYKNQILLLKGQSNQLQKEANSGTLDQRDRLLRLNRIREQAIFLIDDLTYRDLSVPEDEAFDNFKTAYLKNPTASEPESKDQVNIPPKKATITDLEIFCELHKDMFRFFPKLFRKMREHIIRNNPYDPETGPLLEGFQKFQAELNSYREKLQKLDSFLDEFDDHPLHYALTLQVKNRKQAAFNLTFEKIAAIEGLNQELDALYVEMEKNGLI